MKLIDAIMNGDAQAARSEFTAAINDKVSTVLDIRRVAMASDVFNQVKEGAQSKKEMLNPDVTKNLPEEEEELDEAVRVSSERYVRSHSKQPKGRGGWFFSSSSKGGDKGQEFSFNGSYADAKQKAREWAKSKGIDYIYVMEGTEGEEETLEEASNLSPEQERAKNSDFDRVMAGAMKRDDYNKKWKLGQYKTNAGSPFIAKMLSSPVKKEGVESEEDDLEEAQTPGQKFDFQKVLHGAMSQDEYNNKYKLGKYRPAGNKLAGPGGLYKNLVKKP